MMSIDIDGCTKKGFIPNDGMYLEEDIAWFVGNQDNILYSMDIRTMQVTPVAFLPKESSDTFRLYPKCVKYRNRIYCLPDKGHYINIYNIENATFEKVYVENPSGVRISIFDAWVDGNFLWCVSYGMNQIFEFNLETQRIDGYYEIFITDGDMVGYTSSKVGHIIHCTSRTSNVIAAFDTISKEMKYYRLSINDKGLNTIVFDGKDFWLSGYLGQVYCWNKESNYIQILSNFPQGYKNACYTNDHTNVYTKHPLFYKSLIENDDILFVPWIFTDDENNPIIKVNKRNMEISTLQVESDGERGNCITIEYLRDNRYLIINHLMSSCLEQWDLKEMSVIQREMLVSQEKMVDFMNKNMGRMCILHETKIYTTKLFLDFVLTNESNL